MRASSIAKSDNVWSRPVTSGTLETIAFIETHPHYYSYVKIAEGKCALRIWLHSNRAP